MKELLNEIYNKAQQYGQCGLLRGDESLSELVNLIFTPQGVEFMITHNFPDLDILRKFKEYHPEQYGLYIDGGDIDLTETRRIFLIGNTVATLNYRETAANKIYLMHGAKARINAAGYAVVRVEADPTSEVSTVIAEHGKILI